MSNFPDFSSHGYQVKREIGHNLAGGRVTYQAINTNSQQAVTIKQFQFAESASDWSGFKSYEREIQVLRGLNHPGIPRYLDSFETPAGFCMVQEYKDAQSLVVSRQWTPQEIKQIAVSVLEILVYLQNRIPPVIHRDIKPENVLVDEQLNVYLVDFGLARIGGGEGAMSSVAAGTFGFMAPEQIYNRELSKATDLYGLGTTIICLLTGIKSAEIESLIDETGRINFKERIPQLNRRFIDWLEKMVQPKQKDRYSEASAAKEALLSVNFTVVPEVKISESILQLKATKLGEKVTKTIAISNPIPKTVLKGKWSVAQHPSDPPHTPLKHAWISFDPASFKGNQVECSVTVDTSNLLADKVYTRQILLQTNSYPETHSLTIEVQAGSIHIPVWDCLAALFISIFLSLVFCAVSEPLIDNIYTSLTVLNTQFAVKLNVTSNVLFIALNVSGAIFWSKIGYKIGFTRGLVFSAMTLPAYGLLLLAFQIIYYYEWGFFLRAIILTANFAILGSLVGSLVKEHRQAGFTKKFALSISLLAIAFGTSVGSWLLLTREHPFAMSAMIGTGLLLAAMILYMPLQRKKLMDDYRQSEPNRIKP